MNHKQGTKVLIEGVVVHDGNDGVRVNINCATIPPSTLTIPHSFVHPFPVEPHKWERWDVFEIDGEERLLMEIDTTKAIEGEEDGYIAYAINIKTGDSRSYADWRMRDSATFLRNVRAAIEGGPNAE